MEIIKNEKIKDNCDKKEKSLMRSEGSMVRLTHEGLARLRQERRSPRTVAVVVGRGNGRRPEHCNQMLRRLMDERGMTPSQLSKASGVDLRTLSKILNFDGRRPTVETLSYLAIGLHLSYMEAIELLRSAGQALTDTDPFDVAIKVCLWLEIYDLKEVDNVIEKSSEALLKEETEGRLRGD